MKPLKGKTILLGVTGSIAVYKSCDLIRRLLDRGACLKIVMTESAQKFVTPLLFEALTGEPVISSLWKRVNGYPSTIHISLAEQVDCAVVAPATANIIGKIRAGISDEILSCILCAFEKPILVVPAMNTVMYNSLAVQENITVLKKRGITFINPIKGMLVCRTVGIGKMAETETIISAIEDVLS